jgi:sporulation integral membrane protein YlbJ
MFKLAFFILILIVAAYLKTSSIKITPSKKNKVFLFLTSLIVTFFVISLITFPEACYKAAVNGVTTWINIVLPALLPFFIGAELMIGLGIIDFIGIMLEPFMRPLFNTPGLSSFVFIMSITSGYPVGVKLTCNLRQQGKCTRLEAQRMLAFCSTSGPLFMIGAVSIGMLGNAAAGTVIAISHYLASVMLGIFCGRLVKDRSSVTPALRRLPSIKSGLKAMYRKRVEDGRPLGVLLGEAVRESINTLLMVGGFIIMFSVVIEVCTITGLLDYISAPIASLLSITPLPSNLVKPVLSGIMEITIGSRMISSVASVPLIYKIFAISFIIGWSGFSIHAQAVSFIGKTDLNPGFYLISKFFHGVLASAISVGLSMLTMSDQVQQVYLPKMDGFYSTSFSKQLIASTEILFSMVAVVLLFIAASWVINFVIGFNSKRS